MQFPINGVQQTFMELRAFRQIHDLPNDFSIALFEEKTYEGLGSIERAGAELKQLKTGVLSQLPSYDSPSMWHQNSHEARELFHRELLVINHVVALRQTEVEFAVNGFVDVISQWVFALIYHQSAGQPLDFDSVYREWMTNSLRVAAHVNEYQHQGEPWQIQIVSHVYGRFGMQIIMPTQTVYVYDHQLACPAEGFMQGLIQDVAVHIQTCCGL